MTKEENINMVNNVGNYEKNLNARVDAKKIRKNVPLKFVKKWEAISFVETLLPACFGFLGAVIFVNHFLYMDLNDINYILGSFFQSLTRREYSVLIMRFSHQMSLREASMIIDVTQERIRQIEARALRKLRHPHRIINIKKLLLPNELDELENYDSLDKAKKHKWLIEKHKQYNEAKEIQMKKENRT